MPTMLVSGGAGFIGSNFIPSALQNPAIRLINLDKLTYAGNLTITLWIFLWGKIYNVMSSIKTHVETWR